MAIVTVEQAQAGMVLAEGVVDRRGRLLIPAGNELSERHVQALKTWGVTHIEVEGEQPDAVPSFDADPDILAQAEQDIDARLANNDPALPFVQTLRACAVRRRALELVGGRA